MSSSKPQDKRQTIIFVHIPKAGGSTVENILWRLYDTDSIVRLSSVKAERMRDIASFKAMPPEQKKKIKVLTGIMDFGLHAYLPQPATYITILRDPVERVISHYYFVLNTPQHYLHEQVRTENMGLQEYVVRCPLDEMDNAQTRLISGMDAQVQDGDFQPCTQADLFRAKANIERHFAVAGTLERFDGTLILIKQKLGWPHPLYTRQNINRKRMSQEVIPAKTIRFIKEHNELDIQLYQHVREGLEKALDRRALSLKRALLSFRLLNTLYGRYPKIYWYLCRITARSQKAS